MVTSLSTNRYYINVIFVNVRQWSRYGTANVSMGLVQLTSTGSVTARGFFILFLIFCSRFLNHFFIRTFFQFFLWFRLARLCRLAGLCRVARLVRRFWWFIGETPIWSLFRFSWNFQCVFFFLFILGQAWISYRMLNVCRSIDT